MYLEKQQKRSVVRGDQVEATGGRAYDYSYPVLHGTRGWWPLVLSGDIGSSYSHRAQAAISYVVDGLT